MKDSLFSYITNCFLGVLFLSALSFPALATTVSYYLDQSNVLANGTNYLQVTISDSTTTAGDIDFTVDVLTANFPSPGTNFGMETFAFNFDNSLTVGATNIINVDPSSWGITEDQNAGGGFGRFEFQLSGTGSTRTELLTFTISGVAGDTPSSYALGSTLNPQAVEFFAAHVADFDDGYGNTSGKFAGSTAVPVPAALWLFGSGLICLARLARRNSTT